MKSKELKALDAQLKVSIQMSENLKSDISQKQKEYFQMVKDIKNTQKKIDEIKQAGSQLIITDHAILRYLERVKGINVEEIKEEIITPEIKNIIATLGSSSGTYPSGTGYSVVLKKNTVVTVIIE